MARPYLSGTVHDAGAMTHTSLQAGASVIAVSESVNGSQVSNFAQTTARKKVQALAVKLLARLKPTRPACGQTSISDRPYRAHCCVQQNIETSAT
jgi:hypothetical protein